MKANRTLFSKIQLAWDIRKMTTAYIDAEKYLIQQTANGNDVTGMQVIETFEPMTPEEFNQYETDGFGNIRNITPKELIKQKMDAIEDQGRKLLEAEKYELFAELKEIYEKYKQEYDRL